MNEPKEHDLTRFLDAQAGDFDVALQELVKGRKRSHWMWYIFPQVAGLGYSWMAEKYAIRSRGEAAAYLNHEVLGPRLRQCAAALLPHQDKSIAEIMSYPDNLKLRSSMTLFAAVAEPESVFAQVLEKFYAGDSDVRTVRFFEDNPW